MSIELFISEIGYLISLIYILLAFSFAYISRLYCSRRIFRKSSFSAPEGNLHHRSAVSAMRFQSVAQSVTEEFNIDDVDVRCDFETLDI